jgi:hypothetical protein
MPRHQSCRNVQKSHYVLEVLELPSTFLLQFLRSSILISCYLRRNISSDNFPFSFLKSTSLLFALSCFITISLHSKISVRGSLSHDLKKFGIVLQISTQPYKPLLHSHKMHHHLQFPILFIFVFFYRCYSTPFGI